MKNSILHFLAGLVIITAAAHAAPIPIHAEADLVLGQVSYTSSTLLIPPTDSSLNAPTSVVVDPVTRKVFVGDGANTRILRYASADSLASGAAAEAVFGQLLFTTTTAFPYSAPDGLASSAQVLFLDTQNRLWVTDGFANRVLMFENATARVSTRTADKVFGQPDLTTATYGLTGITTASSMGNPSDVCVDAADRLWVADTNNNRVLRFDNISSKASGASADAVLGQTDFISRDMIDTAAGIGSPYGVAIGANGTLYVTCHRQHRVLRFDDPASPTRPNKNANAVFGQPDFTTITPGLSAVKMEGPFGACITADDSLWVTDHYNCRLLRFSNASTASNGATADGLLGQSNFAIPTAFRTRRGLTLPYSKPFVDGKGALWIADRGNYRVLRFSPPADTALKITSISKSGNTVSVGFQGISGLSYQLNKSTDLNFTTSNIKAITTLTGTSLGSLQDTTANEPAAFYRVEAQ
jgi:streptogramin lyase